VAAVLSALRGRHGLIRPRPATKAT
jgi:hypothetical protein